MTSTNPFQPELFYSCRESLQLVFDNVSILILVFQAENIRLRKGNRKSYLKQWGKNIRQQVLKRGYSRNFVARSFRKSVCCGAWLEEEANTCEPSAGTWLCWCENILLNRQNAGNFTQNAASGKFTLLFCCTLHVFPSDHFSYVCMHNINQHSFTEGTELRHICFG